MIIAWNMHVTCTLFPVGLEHTYVFLCNHPNPLGIISQLKEQLEEARLGSAKLKGTCYIICCF